MAHAASGDGAGAMTSIARRRLARLGLGGLAAPSIARFAHAAQYNWRIGHLAPLDTALHRRLTEAADAILKRSDGQLRLTVLGEGRAGNQSGLMEQIRNGGIEMAAETGALLSRNSPLCEVPLTGFMFNDYAKVWSAIDGELGRMIRAQIPPQLGCDVLDAVWDFGFRDITTTAKPIRTAADVAGLKIRTPVDSQEMDLFRSLSATPIVITLRFLRAALEHRQVDGQEGMLQVLDFARLSEVQPWCATSRHIWDGLWICVNSAAWRGLPDRLRSVVSNTLNVAAQRQREDSAASREATKAELTRNGMTFTDVDTASFRAALRRNGYYARVKERWGTAVWAVAERTTDVAS